MNGHMTQLDPNNFPFATQGWNQYNYAGADSANLSDPNGMLFGPVNLNSPFRNGMILPRTGVVPAPLPPPSQWSCYFGGVFCRVQLDSNQTDGLIGALGIAGPTTAWLSGVTAGAVLLDKSLHGGTGAVLCVLAGQPPVLF